MTRKHVNDLVQALASTRPDRTESDISVVEFVQWKRDVRAVADICLTHNSTLEYFTFIEACETWEAK